MLIYPGLRWLRSSKIQQLLNSAAFFAPNTHSLNLTLGTGSQTITRATTQTVQNNDGYLVTCLAGEIPIKGGRRIYNLIPAAGTGSASLAVAANKSMTLAAGTYVFSMGAGTGTATFSGTGGATGTLDASASGRVSVSKTITAGTLVVTASVATLVDLQVESVDAQTTKTAGEYVSVGVLSSPWHGAGVDGVKWLSSDINGNPIAAATLDGAEVWPAATTLTKKSTEFSDAAWTTASATVAQNRAGADGGAASGWTITDSSGAASQERGQLSNITSETYTDSYLVAKTSGAQSSYPVVYANQGTNIALATVDTTNGTATIWTAYTGLTIVTSSARCTSYNDFFWLVELTYLGNATAVWVQSFLPAATSNPSQSTGTVDAAVQGSFGCFDAQRELGSFASPRINNTSAVGPATRNASVISCPTASNIASAAGFIALEYTPQHAPSGTVYLWGTYVDANNSTAILHDATNLIFRKRIAGVNYDATIANAFVSGTTYKMAASWGAGGTNIALGGTLGTPHANTTAAQIAATMQTGADGNSASQPGMAIKNVYVGNRALSNAELQAISLR